VNASPTVPLDAEVAGRPPATSARQAGPPRRLRARFPRGLGFALPLIVLLVVSFNLPILGVFLRSIGSASEPTLEYYQQLVNRPAYLRVLTNTFRIAAVVTVITCLLGYPLSYWISRLRSRGRLIALTLVILPFWTSILVRTYSWIILLGFRGVVNETLLRLGITGSPYQLVFNDLGVTIGMVHVLMPFVVLPLVTAMMGVDQRLLRAGQSLGAPPRTVFRRIYFPLTTPALAAGGILVFILSLGFFVTPAILGGGRVSMIATVLDTFINRLPRWELAAALSMILLVASLAFYAVYRRVGGIIR
jgi:ABC-type spermidine/putrescine transport system permease subunit I